jgi:Fur family transcriptional regulator, ferric uptake regulator
MGMAGARTASGERRAAEVSVETMRNQGNWRQPRGQSPGTETGGASQAPAARGNVQPITVDRILALFETMGLSRTRPRRHIAERLAALAASGSDFTADGLWHDLQESEPHVGRATVYRAVDVLLGQGLLDRVAFANGTHRYRLCGGAHHHHVTCTRCHRVVEVDACLPPEVLSAIERNTDFALDGHALELFGRCAECRTDGAV